VRGVFKAGGRNKKMEVAVIGPVWWRMPRAGVVLAALENFFALLGGELTPDVMRCGHVRVRGMESRL
jgi:hypothetical protein